MAGLISLSKATSEFIQEKKLYVKQLFFFFRNICALTTLGDDWAVLINELNLEFYQIKLKRESINWIFCIKILASKTTIISLRT